MHTLEKSGPKFWATSLMFGKLLKVNNRPLGENSTSLVILKMSKAHFRSNSRKPNFTNASRDRLLKREKVSRS
jgi:hypothetical protein